MKKYIPSIAILLTIALSVLFHWSIEYTTIPFYRDLDEVCHKHKPFHSFSSEIICKDRGEIKGKSVIDPEGVVDNINKMRVERGLVVVTIDDRLVKSSSIKACDMRDNNYFSHSDLNGNKSWHLIIENGFNYLHAGENLARDYYSAEQVVIAWKNSPKHAEVMFHSGYDKIGVSICGKYTVAHLGVQK